MMISEKYRPQSLDDVVGNKNAILSLKNVLKYKHMPHLLFFGPPGVGKTTSAKIIATEITNKENTLELNASDDRGIDVVRETIKQFTQLKSTSMKIIILDECDSMTTPAQQALRRIMETHSENSRFILICNNFKKVIEPIQSRCAIYEYKNVEDEVIKQRIELIIEKEKLNINEKCIDLIAELSNGDVRQAMNFIQTISEIKDVTPQIILKISGVPSPEMIRRIIKETKVNNYRKALKIFNVLWAEGFDPTDLISTFFRECRKINDVDSMDIIAKYYTKIFSGTDSRIQFLAMIVELCGNKEE
ncbi:Replication factor C subunit 4 [Cucumispora dikerogammari]|nr:Replication factor C subunit 4 [Cucumispora dikerogammari]